MENVLITGATSGIGYEITKIFAQNQHDLLLCARDKKKLIEIREKLINEYKVKVFIFSKDLSKEKDVEELYREIMELGINVDILINNAGAGYVGEFINESYDRDKSIMSLNMNAVTYLTKVFANEMIKINKGKILNVASTGSYHPGPYTAVYYATKAYVLSFTEALAEVMKEYNITVSALCPGATKTNFSKKAGKKDNATAMSPEYVAQKAYEGLIKNNTTIIPGFKYKIFVLLPRKIITPFIGRYQRKLKNN